MNNLNNKNASPLKVILAFAVVYIVWGSTYFFIQKAITDFPPLLLGAMRFIIAGIVMLGWTRLKGESVFVKNDIKHAAVSGFLMLFIGTGAVIWVEQYLPSAMVAIMVSSGSLWFILLDRRKWGENFRSKATIGGLVFGFAGVFILFSEKIISAFSTGANQQELGGFGLLIIGSMGWAAGSLYSKYNPISGSVSVNIGWQMLAAGLAFVPGSLLLGELQQVAWHSISADAWISLLFLVVFGSIVAFSAYVWLLQVRSAAQVSTHAYVNPVVAVLLGVFFANEHISLLQVLGLTIILGSVLIINLVKYRNGHNAAQNENVMSKPPVTQNTLKAYSHIVSRPLKKLKGRILSGSKIH